MVWQVRRIRGDQPQLRLGNLKEVEHLPLVIGDLDQLAITVVAYRGTASARAPIANRTLQLDMSPYRPYIRRSLTVFANSASPSCGS